MQMHQESNKCGGESTREERWRTAGALECLQAQRATSDETMVRALVQGDAGGSRPRPLFAVPYFVWRKKAGTGRCRHSLPRLSFVWGSRQSWRCGTAAERATNAGEAAQVRSPKISDGQAALSSCASLISQFKLQRMYADASVRRMSSRRTTP
jgi:hypothetical protein